MTNSRFDHYVSVAYFESNGKFIETKLNWYEKDKAENIFARTLNKYKESIEHFVIIQLRDVNHNLLQAERNFGWEIVTKKRKKTKGKSK